MIETNLTELYYAISNLQTTAFSLDMECDDGVYYVYENGFLRTSMGKPIPQYKIQQQQEETGVVRREFYESSVTSTSDGLHSAPSLLNITIGFVADNLHLVETFIGIPDELGKPIFQTAVKGNNFSELGKKTKQWSTLFTEAYQELFLSALRITSHDFLNHLMDGFCGLHHLSKLDLNGCNVGDDHQIIKLIGQEFTRYS